MVEGDEALLVFLVVEHGVALRERAALHVLTRQADGISLGEDRAERQRFAGRPVDARARLDRLLPAVEEAAHGAVDVECLRRLDQPRSDVLKAAEIDAGMAAPRVFPGFRGFESTP